LPIEQTPHVEPGTETAVRTTRVEALAYPVWFAGLLVVAGALYLDWDVVAAAVFTLAGAALAVDVGGLATRVSRSSRWRELYRGQYSPMMMRIGGGIMVIGGAYWIWTLVR
jgi:hypothetical protein